MHSQSAMEGMPSTLQTWRSSQCRTSSRTTRWAAAMPPTSWPSESVSSASEQVASASNICSEGITAPGSGQVKVYKDSVGGHGLDTGVEAEVAGVDSAQLSFPAVAGPWG